MTVMSPHPELLSELETLEAIYAELLSVPSPSFLLLKMMPPMVGQLLAPEDLKEAPENAFVVCQVDLPPSYPYEKIRKENVMVQGSWLDPGAALDIVEDAISTLYSGAGEEEERGRAGEPILFELFENVKEMLPMPPHDVWMHAERPANKPECEEEEDEQGNDRQIQLVQKDCNSGKSVGVGVGVGSETSIFSIEGLGPMFSSEPLTDRKSTFQAYCVSVSSQQEVDLFCNTLKSNSKIARATHNMIAYRFSLPSNEDSGGRRLGGGGGAVGGYDSDGEDAAGGRLGHLLTMTGADNVCVMVSRWYGGVHLGPDRFKHINNVAREAMENGAFIEKGGKKKPKKKGKK